jgi:hypothetical protein
MDIVDKIMAYEQGEMNEQDMVTFFQELIDAGLVWQLQGHYGRTATRLIEAGLCSKQRRNHARV